ncbi:Vitamin B12 import ATP-binding protein BtuD [termite gut metagenome]|uniref:Vitamin B12 import ATP-binding protein BtuD n=1 Tax=termite gut metagenome TaxID=433724 RepID=A0A5J4QRS7_9ZZZZ
MELKFKQEFKSISTFNTIELTDFSILTGYNGSGKSHLLESIVNGSSQIDNIAMNEVVLFDYKTFYLENEPIINNQQLNQEKLNVWQKFNNQTNSRNTLNYKGILLGYKQQLGIENYKRILKIGQGKPLLKIPISDFNDKDLYDAYNKYRGQIYGFFGNYAKDHPEIPAIKSLCISIPIALDELTEDDFYDYYTPVVLKNNFLPSQIGKLFMDYWNKYQMFLFKQIMKTKTYEEDILRTNFEKKYGPRPWRLIEDILLSFSSFEYTINNPEKIEIDPSRSQSFSLTLQHKTKKITVPFNSLSSGEKILFSLVLSIYKSVGDKVFPSLLLLDEIDASLHPSQIQNLLNVINQIFVQQNKVKVIIATHSPTTIALAEEENIFVVNKEGEIRVERQSKQEALRILSEGFITLDEGLHIIDQMVKKELTIFTEGNNLDYIRKAIELIEPEILDKIDIVENLKDRTGKNQLLTLYGLFSRMNHKRNILFICDCDVTTKVEESEHTFYYVIPQNNTNTKVIKGIENLFPENLFEVQFYPQKPKNDGGFQASLDKQVF